MNAIDLRELNGRIVLVCSADDRRNPPTGRRGTLKVVEPPQGGAAVVTIEVEFPEMFTSRAHIHRIQLNPEQVSQMLESSDYGAMTVRVPGPLDPNLAPGNE